MILYRTFIGQINCVFTLPESKNHKKIIVFCPGLPGQPENKNIMEFYSRQGFTCFFIKYRGTWESGGNFLEKSPEEDVREVIDYLNVKKRVTELYNLREIDLKFDEIFVFGSSFGGSVALVAGAKNQKVAKITALAPVVDYRSQGKEKSSEEDMQHTGEYISRAYGYGYRLESKNWKKLLNGDVDLNPKDYVNELRNKQVFILHGESDLSVSPQKTKNFFSEIKKSNSQYVSIKDLGHLSFSNLPDENRYEISKWLLKN